MNSCLSESIPVSLKSSSTAASDTQQCTKWCMSWMQLPSHEYPSQKILFPACDPISIIRSLEVWTQFQILLERKVLSAITVQYTPKLLYWFKHKPVSIDSHYPVTQTAPIKTFFFWEDWICQCQYFVTLQSFVQTQHPAKRLFPET